MVKAVFYTMDILAYSSIGTATIAQNVACNNKQIFPASHILFFKIKTADHSFQKTS